jgi:flagellin
LGTTSVASGGTELTGNSVRLDAPGATFLASAAQTFTFNLYSSNGGAQSQTFSVGGSGALTEQQVLSSLNGHLSQYGIQASVGSDGQLQFGGGTPFTISTSTTATDAIATDNSTATNNGDYTIDGGNYVVETENLTFQNANGTAHVALSNSETLASGLSKINAQTAALGIYAVANSAGDGISVQSTGNFTLSSDANDGAFWAVGPQTIVPPTTSASVTGNAQAAITAIDAAIQNLGLVQGRVGAGENMLNYGISLANSQITGFSAAESGIRDANMAAEAANLTKAQVLEQSSIAALAQANSAPEAVLALLKS